MPAWFPWKTIYFETFFSLLWGGVGFFHIEFFFLLFLGAIYSMRGGGGGLFLIMCRIFFCAHALVVRVIANMVHW